jgi:hypothetical protein
MSYRRFDTDDLVVSADSITTPAWSNNVTTLTTFFTSATQTATNAGKYYYHIYDTGSAAGEIQFAIAYGHRKGSGSALFNSGEDGKSYSSAVYGQFRTLITGDEDTDFTFTSAGTAYSPDNLYFISVQRARFREKILPGTMTLKLSGSAGGELSLTDNSKNVSTDTFVDAGRQYSLYSGSLGTVTDTTIEYGKLYPDVGIIALDANALSKHGYVGTINSSSNYTGTDNKDLLHSSLQSGSHFKLRADETLSSNFIFVRARNSEFNYSTNPSNITGSGELRHSVMIDNPQGYITQVGLYNDNNDLLAVAKLSTPLLKDFTKEALVRIKLDF